jgi:hypothetical protein
MSPKARISPLERNTLSALQTSEKENDYIKNTKKMIGQAVKVLDGEKAYNDANLDQYLMGIRKIKVEKKILLPKLLPTLDESAKYKLSKEDENFYQQYSAINDGISNRKLSNEDINVLMSPITPF